MSLPIHPSHRSATTACVYCPKLCRPACPVANVTGNDAESAWGLMNAIDRADSSGIEGLKDAYACSGCMGCESHCEIGIPVTKTVRAARAAVFDAQQLPPNAESFSGDLGRREVKLRTAALELHTFKSRVEHPGQLADEVVLFPGCSTVVTEPSRVERMRVLLERKLGTTVRVFANECCGLPLLELGDEHGFARQSQRISEQLTGVKLVVTLDPGCAHASKMLSATPVSMKTMVELAQENDWISANVLSGELQNYSWHDPCRMGRGLSLYEPPRAALKHLTGRAALELAARESDALCSGGGGLLPVTHPETADRMSQEMKQRMRLAGTEQLVTGCPTARRRFEKMGIRASLLDDWILAGLDKSEQD